MRDSANAATPPLRRPPHKWTAWKAWFAILAASIGFILYPVSNVLTRSGVLISLLASWAVLMAILWRHPWIRALMLLVPGLCAGFLALPSQPNPGTDSLRREFVDGMRHYEGVRYFWGGETITGIDCSGLVRRGLIDSLFARGIRTLNAGLVRRAIGLWWHDCSARDLADAQSHLTTPVLDTPSINALDHSRLLPGDLAVTSSGEHVMAYVGNRLWIEADPLARRVITVSAPSPDNAWFHGPVSIVRWNTLSEQSTR